MRGLLNVQRCQRCNELNAELETRVDLRLVWSRLSPCGTFTFEGRYHRSSVLEGLKALGSNLVQKSGMAIMSDVQVLIPGPPQFGGTGGAIGLFWTLLPPDPC